MIVKNVKCNDVRRDLLRQDELDAFDRGRLDIHLRRCVECNRIAKEFSAIEKSAPELEEVSTERRRDIYNRLVPAVHEITAQVPPPPKPVSGHFDTGINSKKLLVYGAVALSAMTMAYLLSNLLVH